MENTNNNRAAKLELHFILNDDTHFMDAFIKNKCEAELLAVAKELGNLLYLSLNFESEALAEGGLREFIKVAIKNSVVAAMFIDIFINVISNILTTDPELIALQKEEYRLHIAQLQQELKTSNRRLNNYSEQQLVESIIENQKIRKRKSNFFQQAIKCKKLDAIAFGGVNSENKPVEDPKTVKQADFPHYILTSDDLEPVIDEDATIEIIAPVLKTQKYTWKGAYKGSVISFVMSDLNFRAQVSAREISFINGSSIDCVVKIFRKLDECGVEKITKYSVENVNNIHDQRSSKVTPQGKAYKRRKKSSQGYVEQDLFDF